MTEKELLHLKAELSRAAQFYTDASQRYARDKSESAADYLNEMWEYLTKAARAYAEAPGDRP